MRWRPYSLILLIAAFGVSANGLGDARDEFNGRRPGNLKVKGPISEFKKAVVANVRATSAVIKEEATESSNYDVWLGSLAAMGMVVFRLRRSHKSLPQRSLSIY